MYVKIKDLVDMGKTPKSQNVQKNVRNVSRIIHVTNRDRENYRTGPNSIFRPLPDQTYQNIG